LPQDHRRRAARHCDLLSRESLFQQTANLLTDTGRFCLVLPSAQANSTIELARSVGFHLWSRTDVRPTTESEVKRVLLEFGPETDSDMSAKRTELVIETARHQYSDQYEALTKDFHLRYVSGQ
jgi:tRNA1Val (adenine37-N6)-methyltransferase